jgi:hypothetical protein
VIRVPRDPVNASFDDAFMVSILQWIRATPEERAEWKRRRTSAVNRRRRPYIGEGGTS